MGKFVDMVSLIFYFLLLISRVGFPEILILTFFAEISANAINYSKETPDPAI